MNENAIKITTRFNEFEIEQDVHYSNDARSAIAKLSRNIINLRDAGIRKALRELGWIAPPGANDPTVTPWENALKARAQLQQWRNSMPAVWYGNADLDAAIAAFDALLNPPAPANTWKCPNCSRVNPTFDPWCSGCETPQPEPSA